jgi:O-antigen biosynthesis protein
MIPASAVSLVLEPTGRPYYVVAPAYDERSAGNRVLHLLAQVLLRHRVAAFVADIGLGSVGRGPFSGPIAVPTLTPSIVRRHERDGVVPIVIYPETVQGNPLGAATVVRYYLNYPGVLGGPTSFDDDEIRVGYSSRLAASVGTDLVLTIPTSDPDVFRPLPNPGDLVLAYANKARRSTTLVAVPSRAVEITPRWPARADLPGVLARGRVMHVWEDSALITEAQLSGCPVVLHAVAGVTEGILHDELGTSGYALDDEDTSLAEARASLPEFRRRYEQLAIRLPDQVVEFVERTQGLSAIHASVDVRRLRRRSAVVPAPSALAIAHARWTDLRAQITSGLRRR